MYLCEEIFRLLVTMRFRIRLLWFILNTLIFISAWLVLFIHPPPHPNDSDRVHILITAYTGAFVVLQLLLSLLLLRLNSPNYERPIFWYSNVFFSLFGGLSYMSLFLHNFEYWELVWLIPLLYLIPSIVGFWYWVGVRLYMYQVYANDEWGITEFYKGFPDKEFTDGDESGTYSCRECYGLCC